MEQSQQYPQEVSALFYIRTTRSHPPIPEQLSAEAKDFLLKCFHKEPDLTPSASDLLLHPFIICEYHESHSISHGSVRDSCNRMATDGTNSRNFLDSIQGSTCTGLKDVCQVDSLRFSNANLLKSASCPKQTQHQMVIHKHNCKPAEHIKSVSKTSTHKGTTSKKQYHFQAMKSGDIP